ncbi:unnamed protein product [Polarella glacialis]|uniref:Uncharacterized protein n=1 Tax=Polarella glacialis TaxID=89957 RepID=A0A813H7G2_POLGL|nr:unnamed protein product [Polarella glacialis]CAE8726616.1 unnamed protein product [Polarella glacialis]
MGDGQVVGFASGCNNNHRNNNNNNSGCLERTPFGHGLVLCGGGLEFFQIFLLALTLSCFAFVEDRTISLSVFYGAAFPQDSYLESSSLWLTSVSLPAKSTHPFAELLLLLLLLLMLLMLLLLLLLLSFLSPDLA